MEKLKNEKKQNCNWQDVIKTDKELSIVIFS